jgi:hypothetical protein
MAIEMRPDTKVRQGLELLNQVQRTTLFLLITGSGDPVPYNPQNTSEFIVQICAQYLQNRLNLMHNLCANSSVRYLNTQISVRNA